MAEEGRQSVMLSDQGDFGGSDAGTIIVAIQRMEPNRCSGLKDSVY